MTAGPKLLRPRGLQIQIARVQDALSDERDGLRRNAPVIEAPGSKASPQHGIVHEVDPAGGHFLTLEASEEAVVAKGWRQGREDRGERWRLQHERRGPVWEIGWTASSLSSLRQAWEDGGDIGEMAAGKILCVGLPAGELDPAGGGKEGGALLTLHSSGADEGPGLQAIGIEQLRHAEIERFCRGSR